MIRSFTKASKKAAMILVVVFVSTCIQGCDIAAIMSAAGGVLAGLGQAFGGPTGQVLGQVGQLLGGVGQAFGQQQAGIAGQLAGAAGQLGGPLTNPQQNPLGGVLNPQQNPLGGVPNPLGQLQLPNPGDLLQQAIARLRTLPTPPTPAQIAQAAQSVTPNPQLAAQIAAQIQQQIAAAGGQFIPPGLPNGQGAPAGFPIPAFPPQIAQINQQMQTGLQIGTSIANLINLFRGNNQGPVQQPQVTQPQITVPTNNPPTTQTVLRA